jgi:hypothetical protein
LARQAALSERTEGRVIRRGYVESLGCALVGAHKSVAEFDFDTLG